MQVKTRERAKNRNRENLAMQNVARPLGSIDAFRLEPKSMEVALERRREGHLNYLWKDTETFMRNDMFVSLFMPVGGIMMAIVKKRPRTSFRGTWAGPSSSNRRIFLPPL